MRRVRKPRAKKKTKDSIDDMCENSESKHYCEKVLDNSSPLRVTAKKFGKVAGITSPPPPPPKSKLKPEYGRHCSRKVPAAETDNKDMLLLFAVVEYIKIHAIQHSPYHQSGSQKNVSSESQRLINSQST